MNIWSDQFNEIWLADFEFSSLPGDRPDPVCLVAWELRRDRKLRIWQDELCRLKEPPYSVGFDSLFVAYYASAEINCHLALGWSVPTNVLDLYAEFRNLTNGIPTTSGSGLVGALLHYGANWMDAANKEQMRQLAIR